LDLGQLRHPQSAFLARAFAVAAGVLVAAGVAGPGGSVTRGQVVSGRFGGDGPPGRFGGLLLGRLLGTPHAGPAHPAADPPPRAERLLVNRTALLALLVKRPARLTRLRNARSCGSAA